MNEYIARSQKLYQIIKRARRLAAFLPKSNPKKYYYRALWHIAILKWKIVFIADYQMVTKNMKDKITFIIYLN